MIWLISSAPSVMEYGKKQSFITLPPVEPLIVLLFQRSCCWWRSGLSTSSSRACRRPP